MGAPIQCLSSVRAACGSHLPRRCSVRAVVSANGSVQSRTSGSAKSFLCGVRPGGFTLLEILAALVLLAVLSGSVLGLAVGVRERADGMRAKAELAVLAQALEVWRSEYGDYPSVGDAVEFYEALTGRRGPGERALDAPGRVFIDASRFRLRCADRAAPGNVLLDPWEQPYHYVRFTRPAGGCEAPGCVLFSGGPDGSAKPDDPPSSGDRAGLADLTAPENADNIYAGQ